jgi:hypothetical protein
VRGVRDFLFEELLVPVGRSGVKAVADGGVACAEALDNLADDVGMALCRGLEALVVVMRQAARVARPWSQASSMPRPPRVDPHGSSRWPSCCQTSSGRGRHPYRLDEEDDNAMNSNPHQRKRFLNYQCICIFSLMMNVRFIQNGYNVKLVYKQ